MQVLGPDNMRPQFFLLYISIADEIASNLYEAEGKPMHTRKAPPTWDNVFNILQHSNLPTIVEGV